MLFPISSKALPSAPKDKPAAGVLVRQSNPYSVMLKPDAMMVMKNNLEETEFR